MKKMLVVFLALGALSFAPSAEAGRSRKTSGKSCEKKECKKTCAPKCETKKRSWIVQEPCCKWIKVEGTCDHEVCETITTCTEESKKCIGPCNATCANAVDEASRSEADMDDNNAE